MKGSPYQNMNDVPKNANMSGPLVSENIIGVVHDHHITYHLDMDIDGHGNSFVNVRLKKERTSAGESPRKSYMKAERHVAQTENNARIRLNLYNPSEYHVINPSKLSRLGNPAGYKVVPGGNAASLLDHDDPPQLRGAFTDNQVMTVSFSREDILNK